MSNSTAQNLPKDLKHLILPVKDWYPESEKYHPEHLIKLKSGRTFTEPAMLEIIFPKELFLNIVGCGKVYSKTTILKLNEKVEKGLGILNSILGIRKEIIRICSDVLNRHSLTDLTLQSTKFKMKSYRQKIFNNDAKSNHILHYLGSTGWFEDHPSDMLYLHSPHLSKTHQYYLPNQTGTHIRTMMSSPLLIIAKKSRLFETGNSWDETSYCIGQYMDIVLKDVINSFGMRISDFRDVVRAIVKYDRLLIDYGCALALKTNHTILLSTETTYPDYFRSIYIRPVSENNYCWRIRDGVKKRKFKTNHPN